jgi:hypothetical protein
VTQVRWRRPRRDLRATRVEGLRAPSRDTVARRTPGCGTRNRRNVIREKSLNLASRGLPDVRSAYVARSVPIAGERGRRGRRPAESAPAAD